MLHSAPLHAGFKTAMQPSPRIKLKMTLNVSDFRNSNICLDGGCLFPVHPIGRMLKHIRLAPFAAGIAVGLAMIFWYKAERRIIYEYPHPQNVNERVYRDTNGVCYQYSAKKVGCDANEATLRPYPIQA